jgi:ketosteroid isomerase-like protein
MNRNSLVRSIAVVLGLAVLIGSVLVAAAPARAKDAPDFKAMMMKVIGAWQTMDLSKVAPYYGKEAGAMFFDIAPLKYAGWDAYAAGAGEMFAQWTSLTLTLNDDAWIERHGDVAITAATGRAVIVGKDGSNQALDWRWTACWEKKGKNWLITHEHFSAPLPEPTSPTGE